MNEKTDWVLPLKTGECGIVTASQIVDSTGIEIASCRNNLVRADIIAVVNQHKAMTKLAERVETLLNGAPSNLFAPLRESLALVKQAQEPGR